jgi:hypothetical protein
MVLKNDVKRLLRPLRVMKRLHIPATLGAAVILVAFPFLGVLGIAAAQLSQPASDWVTKLTTSMPEIESKMNNPPKRSKSISSFRWQRGC